MNQKMISMTESEMIATTEDVVVSGDIGAGITACLFSDDGKAGGVVHFLFANYPKDSKENILSYADSAIDQLIKKLISLTGYKPERFSAKLVGAAQLPDQKPPQSRISLVAAQKILSSYQIKVVGEDTGGHRKRKIRFHLKTGRLQSAFQEPLAKSQPQGVPPSRENLSENTSRKKQVLIVDDSKTIRDLLKAVIRQDPRLEVAGEAEDPIEAESLLAKLKPDVITLDVHMPRMTGVQWLKTLLPKHPIAVVMITSLDLKDGNEVFQALELGAVDYIQKPTLSGMNAFSAIIREKLFTASEAKIRVGKPLRLVPSVARVDRPFAADLILAIGASTGGTEALREVLLGLPKEIPPTLVVQHIPAVFSRAFADRLNQLCAFDVKEAEHGDAVHENRVLIAPGGLQMKMVKKTSGYFVEVNNDDPVNRHRPSVDYLFHSIAELNLKKTIGVILTGMGNDGAQGLLSMKNSGALTMSQDEETSVVYGMPKVAWELGASLYQVKLENIANKIIELGSKK